MSDGPGGGVLLVLLAMALVFVIEFRTVLELLGIHVHPLAGYWIGILVLATAFFLYQLWVLSSE